MMPHKGAAYALLRISVGLILTFYGIGKFMMGPGTFADGLVAQFAKTPLPPVMVRAFGLVLPYTELIFGLLLVFGAFTMATLILVALQFMALTLGMILQQQAAVVAQNLLYSLVTFFLLFFHEYNAFALDNLWPRPVRVETAEVRVRRVA